MLVLWARQPLTDVAVASSVMQLLGALTVVMLIPLEHSRTTRPSSLITLYLIAAIVANGVQLRTLFSRKYAPAITHIVSASTGTKFILLILESWPKTAYFIPNDDDLGPEDVSDPFVRNSFWWLNSILLVENRRLLSFEDLPTIDQNLLSKRLQKRMADSWVKCMECSELREICQLTFSKTNRRGNSASRMLPSLVSNGSY
jgi:ATP-binding cassette, subfamily C (CFTR/MRP), member 1